MGNCGMNLREFKRKWWGVLEVNCEKLCENNGDLSIGNCGGINRKFVQIVRNCEVI